MRKWNLQFNGKDPWAFLERVNKLKEDYEFSNQQFLKRLSVLLKRDAQTWCRNNRKRWANWDNFSNFKTTFLPHSDAFQLLENVHATKQKPGNRFLNISQH